MKFEKLFGQLPKRKAVLSSGRMACERGLAHIISCLLPKEKTLRYKFFLSCVFALVAGISQSDAQETREVKIDSRNCVHIASFNDKCDLQPVTGTLFKPKDKTDAVVIIVHGSQGVDERHTNYAKHLNSLGFAALVLDSWSPRGIGKAQYDYAANEKKGARAFNQAIDVLRAAKTLINGPEAYKRVGHIGESIGGVAAIWLTKPYLYSEYTRLFSEYAPSIQANAALYAGCFERVSTDRFLPITTFFLNAELDNDTPAAYCEKFSGWMNSRGGRTSYLTLPGQHHDFDAPYKLTKAPKAENPSECASYIEGSVRIWEKTGERFPMTADGYRAFQKKCVRSAKEAPVNTGYIESPLTGFKEWGDFFLRTLGTP